MKSEIKVAEREREQQDSAGSCVATKGNDETRRRRKARGGEELVCV
jgi:hypothetical protein